MPRPAPAQVQTGDAPKQIAPAPNGPPARPSNAENANILVLDDEFAAQGGGDMRAFKQLLQDKRAMNLFAMLGNAFAVRREPGLVTFYFDPANANLIPMLRMPSLFDQIKPYVTEFFRGNHELRFQLAHDPALRQEREADLVMQERLQQNTAIRFLIDQMNATLIRCDNLEKEQSRV